jgi:hypothetical protein
MARGKKRKISMTESHEEGTISGDVVALEVGAERITKDTKNYYVKNIRDMAVYFEDKYPESVDKANPLKPLNMTHIDQQMCHI